MLVIPEQFPSSPEDVGGVFARDYIEAIRPYCDVTVLLAGNGAPGVKKVVDADGVAYITCTPRMRGDAVWRAKGKRLEGLVRLGRMAPILGDIDLIHGHGAIFNGIPALRIGAQLGVPVVLTVHTNPFSKLLRRRTTRFLTRRTLERADCVCAVSYDLWRQIGQSGIVPRRLEVTYNPIDTELFRSPRHAALNRRITFAGRLEEYKGGLRVARAFANVADRLPGWSLSIAGDGPEREAIEEFIDRCPRIAGRIDLLGSYTKPDLADLFSSSDLCVFPSRHETFGLVIAEAMAAGLPVVAPDRTAPPEFVDDRCGVLVAPDDVRAIADAIEHVATNLTSYDKEAIRAQIVERFGLSAFGERLLEIYHSLVHPTVHPKRTTCAG